MIHSKDKKWGGVNDDGTWNGLVGMLAYGEIDISTAGLSLFEERTAVVDFSIPLSEEAMTLIEAKNKQEATHFWVYMEIFSRRVWASVAGLIVALSVGFFLTRSKENFLSSLAATGLLVLQINPNFDKMATLSSKSLFIFASVLAYLTYNYYTCDLTARMSSEPPKAVIRS